jgi:hypothetical protein
MVTPIRLITVAATLAVATLATAQVDTGRPKDATGLCKDGTFHTGDDQATACRNNGGLQEWWGKVVAPKDAPEAVKAPAADPRGPYDKAEHPKPTVPPAGQKP